MTNNEHIPSVLTVRLFSEKHPAFSQASIRHLIFYAASNGFDKCLRRAGRKILIVESDFFSWLDEQKSGGSHA